MMNLNDKTILITGTDEFIGSRAAELAIGQGLKVRALQADPFSGKTLGESLEKLGVEIIIGSINDPGIATKVCQGVDIVLHTSQLTEEGET